MGPHQAGRPGRNHQSERYICALDSIIRLSTRIISEIFIIQRRPSTFRDLQPSALLLVRTFQSIDRSYRLCEETLADTTMTPFSLHHALSSAAIPFRRNEFLTYVLETRVPGVHFNVDDEERLPKSTTSPLMSKSGRPRIVVGAREDHMIAGHLQNWEGRGSDNAAMKILDEQGSKGSPFPVSEEENFTGDETGNVVLDGISHSQCLQFLYRQGPNFLMKNLKDRETFCSVLLTMADNVKVLPPANEPLPTDLLNMTLWKASLRKLVGEMKTVEENFPSLIGDSGVYVLTSSPFAAFLRALAAEIADVRS